MRRTLVIAAVAAGATLAGAAVPAGSARRQTDDQRLESALAGLIAGPPETCLVDRSRVQRVEGYGSTLLYRVSRNLAYRNDTAGDCGKVAQGDILVTVSTTGRQCQGDLARTVSQVGRVQTGSCALGAFVPYRSAAR